MGRKRKEEHEKKVDVKLYIKKSIVDELKEKKVNMSKLFEESAKDYLKK